MIKIFLDESNPDALKKPNSEKTFYIYGLLIRNEKQYIEIKKKFHQFIDKQPNFNWAYKTNLKSKLKSKICKCESKTNLYYSFDNNDFIENIKHPKKEIININKNFNPISVYEKFLKSISKDAEIFVISFSKEERLNDSMFKTNNDEIYYQFFGVEYANPIRRLLTNILISTGKIFNHYELIEIIFDRTNYYNNEKRKNELSWFLKYSSALFLNINDFFKSKDYKINKKKIDDCLSMMINRTKNLYWYKHQKEIFTTPPKEHFNFNAFLRDMWYFQNKNVFNIVFDAPQFNNEFTIIADWIGKVFQNNKKTGADSKFIKYINTKKLINFNYAFYNRFISFFIETNKIFERHKNNLINQHKLFCQKLEKCKGCYNDEETTKHY